MNLRTAEKTKPVVSGPCHGPTEAFMRGLPNFVENFGNASLQEQVNGLRWEINVIGDPSKKSLNRELCPFEVPNQEWLEWQNRFDPLAEEAVYNIIQIENRHAGYIPFYHGVSKKTFCLSLFTKELLAASYGSSRELPLSAPLIRFPDPTGCRTIQEFLETNSPDRSTSNCFYDWRPDVIRELLPVNPHLFMNLRNENECSWHYFLNDKNVNPPDPAIFFKMVCAEYRLQPTQENIERLASLYQTVVECADEYMQQIRPEFAAFSRGILLQFLVPEQIVEKVCYPCIEAGYIEKSPATSAPFLERLKALREPGQSGDARKNPFQARFLIQSMFVPNHGIRVFTHGGRDFFSGESFKRPAEMNDENWGKLQDVERRKNSALLEARHLFTSLLLNAPSNE